jgi:tetratricopeptide (TPR) repeat protein
MGLRKLKPGTLSDAARKWNRSPIPTGPQMGSDDDGQRPSGALSVGIIVALMVMLGGILYIWQANPPSPAAASIPPPAPAEISEAAESARALMTKRKWAEADILLIRATQRNPDHRDLRLARAECLVAMKRHADAYTQYEKALAIGPREPGIDFAAGIAARESNQSDRAVEHFSMAQAADPHKADYAFALGQMQRKQGNLEACKASLLRAANLEPANAFVWGALAEIALGENNVNLSLQHVAKARELQPDSSEWRLIEARGHKRKGEPQKSLSVLNSIESRQRRDPAVARLMSECYGMLGRAADAASLMADAALASPTDGPLAYDAALAFDRAGNKPKAIEFARYAQASGHEPAVKLLSKLTE